VIQGILFSGGPAWVIVKLVTVTFGAIAVSRLLPGPNRQVPGYRARPMRAAVKYAGGITVAAVLIVACTVAAPHAGRPAASQPGKTNQPIAKVHQPLAIGVFVPGVATSYAPASQFAAATGTTPSFLLAYSALTAPFNTAFARRALAHRAVPFIQLMPGEITMKDVVAGAEDARLRADAKQARALRRQIMLSFAPEPNGNWYQWGWSHTTAVQWVAAWRHVVSVFRSVGALNVTWVWTMNIPFKGSGPVSDYWPGASYVGEVGVDGYYAHASDTFASVFGPIITAVRKLTAKPILISETAIGPDSGARREPQIRGLFAGVKADHLLGFVWFDQAQHDGIYHQDWRLEDDPAALAEFRTAMKKYK
jgi:glycosyl hydrolase family 26